MRPLPIKSLAAAMIALLAIAVVTFIKPDHDATTSNTNTSSASAVTPNAINKQDTESKQDIVFQKQAERNNKRDVPGGVNAIFRDKPKTQVVWMERGKTVVLKNKPEADAADFQNTFFHRGAKARPVTCGEVQFRANDSVIQDYQRFIYTGIQRTYLEHDVINFDVFWSIMCEQTLDEYFEDVPQR